MKVLIIQVGTPYEESQVQDKSRFYKGYSFDADSEMYFTKSELINAYTQMVSVEKQIPVVHGFLGSRKSIMPLLRAGRRIRKMAKSEKVDLVHVLWGSSSSLITVLFSPVPVVISYCGSDLAGSYDSNGNKTKGGRLSVFLSVISSRFAKQIIVKSSFLKSLLPAEAQKKAQVIPNGVFLDLFKPIDKAESRAKLGWDQNEKIVLFFTGNGSHVKNKSLADKVFSLIKSKFENARLILVEKIPFEQLQYYYNGADLMLLTSLHEGSNNSLKEAMCCNLPVVSVDCGDAAERLNGVFNCYVSPAYDENMLAEKAIEILQNGKRSDGREKITPYSIDNIAARVVDVYRKALGK